MQETLIVSFIGITQKGRLKRMAEQTHEVGGKWIDSKVSYLNKVVAAIIKIEVEAEKIPEAKQVFDQYRDLKINFHEKTAASADDFREVKLRIDAKGRPGLVEDITRILVQNDIDIVTLESHQLSVVDLGDNVFTANVTVSLPTMLEPSDLVDEIENISEGVQVTIE